MEVFFSDDNREEYLGLLAEFGREHGVKYLGYCLMDNHIHLLAVPEKEESLALGIGRAHNRYTRGINFRENWRGYLRQGRFSSCPLDDRGAMAVLRYIELNPVRAGLARYAEQWTWSSAAAHVKGRQDALVKGRAFRMDGEEWKGFLREGIREEELKRIRRHVASGRPMGDDAFVDRVERMLNRVLKKRKPGPKRGSKGR